MISAADVARAAGYNSDRYRYTLSFAGRGANETILVKVSCPAKSPAEAIGAASECAVHGLMFAGLAATGHSPEENPLVSHELTDTQRAWLDNFFSSGQFRKYVPSHSQQSLQITRVGKRGGYMVEVVLSVDKRTLRRDLERAEVIERLGAVFERRAE